MSTVPEEKPRKYVPWAIAWVAVVALSVYIGYSFGFSYGENRGWNAGTTKFQEWFNAEIGIHKKYAEMLEVYLKYLEEKEKQDKENPPEDQVIVPVDPTTLIAEYNLKCDTC